MPEETQFQPKFFVDTIAPHATASEAEAAWRNTLENLKTFTKLKQQIFAEHKDKDEAQREFEIIVLQVEAGLAGRELSRAEAEHQAEANAEARAISDVAFNGRLALCRNERQRQRLFEEVFQDFLKEIVV